MNFNIANNCQIEPHKFLDDLYMLVETHGDKSFVDVGAYDGIDGSNTSCLAEKYWPGLMIEANKQSYNKCKQLYKDFPDINVINTAISNKRQKLDMTLSGPMSTLAIDNQPLMNRVKQRKFSLAKVQCQTLDDVLYEYEYEKIGVLSVDVEGYEYKVLEGFDIQKFRPSLCIIECHEGTNPSTQEISEFYQKELVDNINKYFAKNDYSKIYCDHINNIYIDEYIR
ncbi:MAG: hypothetical protein BAJALOKI3v1_50079 [Promethearchaeota archaeon]|nr:MAG: hypothetical protein BAJALOKI3v1_50079 [Candidatus Lokiarchaeota archaeon]